MTITEYVLVAMVKFKSRMFVCIALCIEKIPCLSNFSITVVHIAYTPKPRGTVLKSGFHTGLDIWPT